MSNRVFRKLAVIKNNARFARLIKGTKIVFADGSTGFAKIEELSRVLKPAGLRILEHSFEALVTCGDKSGRGYGESDIETEAVHKAIAEAFERLVFEIWKDKTGKKPTSNGWASHATVRKAKENCINELLERDAVLVHWLCKTPMIQISKNSWPDTLLKWERDELSKSIFPELKILVSTIGFIPTCTVILSNANGHGVAGGGVRSTLEQAVWKGLSEATSLAQGVSEFSEINRLYGEAVRYEANCNIPLSHANYYAFEEKFPDWLFGKVENWNIASKNWRHRMKNKQTFFDSSFNPVAINPLVVGYCENKDLQKLYFGSTKEAKETGLINLDRLRGHLCEDIFYSPHFIA